MPKEMLVAELQRAHLAERWGFCIVGGQDQGITVKIGGVKRSSPAARAGLRKMDYLISMNGRGVFSLDHAECVKEIKTAGLRLTLHIERGDHIVPSFEELFPGLRGGSGDDVECTKRKKHIGLDYYLHAMQNHGLGHLPQPDNFTTVGNNLNIKINQYNCPIQAYSENTIEELRDLKEKGGIDLAGRFPGRNADEKLGFDPSRSNALQVIRQQEETQAWRST